MKKKSKISTIILIVLCFVGLSVLLYPSISDYYNKNFTIRAINYYAESVQKLDEEDYQEIWKQAKAYNEALLRKSRSIDYDKSILDKYDECLNVSGDGVMGYIEIPKINVLLPIYHTVDDAVLLMAAGHIPWTSLPIGGLGTHTVISGHRGLASAKLFSQLDVLDEGDIFTVSVLNETLTYEIDQIRVVTPDDTSELRIEKDKDYCTLLTCTPYGINTHRMLVRGHRVENLVAEGRAVSEAVIIDNLIVASFIAFPILFILFLYVLFKKPPEKKKPPVIPTGEKNNDNPDDNTKSNKRRIRL